MKEIWKNIDGYDGKYQVSNLGRIRITKNDKKRKEKIVSQLINKDGYCIIRLSKNKKKKEYFVHRLVAINFIEYKNNFKYLDDEKNKIFNLEKLTVNHKDENKLNNNIYNLEWCTPRYNVKYSIHKSKRKLKTKIKEIEKYLSNKLIDEKTKQEILEILKK